MNVPKLKTGTKGKYGDAYVGPKEKHPGLLKAKAEKATRDSVLAAQKKKADETWAKVKTNAKAEKAKRDSVLATYKKK